MPSIKSHSRQVYLVLITANLFLAVTALAANDDPIPKLAGMLAGAYQCQHVSGESAAKDTCHGAIPLQPELEWYPSKSDKVFIKLGFNVSNGLNKHSPFSEATWAVEMKDDLKDINGRGRDHLLLAAYQHTYILEQGYQLQAVIGIIDAAEYLDKNAYANDGYSQFMNQALTNGPNVFLPSFDHGIALQWQGGPWSLHGVLMSIGANDYGAPYDFYGVQLAYTRTHPDGDGKYRLVLTQTSRDFVNPTATDNEHRSGMLISIDQAVSDTWGWFVRVGREQVAAVLQHDAIYSGGINIAGKAWNRAEDNIGIGYVYLHGGNAGVKRSQIFETYYRWVITENTALSADMQFLQDALTPGGSVHGWVIGIRGTRQF